MQSDTNLGTAAKAFVIKATMFLLLNREVHLDYPSGNIRGALQRRGRQKSQEVKRDSSLLKHKELNSTNNLNQLGSRFFTRASRKEYSPIVTLIHWVQALWNMELRNSWAMPCPDLSTTELWDNKNVLILVAKFVEISYRSYRKWMQIFTNFYVRSKIFL